jgi:hypothetical protein
MIRWARLWARASGSVAYLTFLDPPLSVREVFAVTRPQVFSVLDAEMLFGCGLEHCTVQPFSSTRGHLCRASLLQDVIRRHGRPLRALFQQFLKLFLGD